MEAKASPTMQAEMDYWTHVVGGFNLGIVGNAAHTYGFHRAGFQVGPLDYSRRHDPGTPYNMEWCCAGDFGHNGDPRLRQMHADLLGRLMNGEHPMIDEFIGQPWPDRPKYYWARWNGIKTLQVYTGAGHYAGKGGWSHVSQRRSTAYLQPNLWVPKSTPIQPTTKDDEMAVIARDPDDGAYYFCIGGMAIPIVETPQKTVADQINDISYLSQQGAYNLAKGAGEGVEWEMDGLVRKGFYEGPAFGLIVHGQGSTDGWPVEKLNAQIDSRIKRSAISPPQN